MKTDLPCAVCKKELDVVHEGFSDAPYGANIFRSSGHYGATAFDSEAGESLELYICTECMKEMADSDSINVVRKVRVAPTFSKKKWSMLEIKKDDD
jgi:hypothetical protein